MRIECVDGRSGNNKGGGSVPNLKDSHGEMCVPTKVPTTTLTS